MTGRQTTLGLALVILGAGLACAQESLSQVRDVAGLFSIEAVRQARERLERLEREQHVPVVLETVDTTRGESIDALALRRARQSGPKGGVLILMAKQEHKLRVEDAHSFLGSQRRQKVQEAFSHEFARGNFDAGLEAGITALEAAVREARAAVPREAATADTAVVIRDAGAAPLVVRNQVRLSLAGAQRIITQAQAKAEAMRLKVNIAVVDDGGHLIAFARMDGARPASGYTAITKATTAATFRAPTGPVPAGASPPDVLLNLSLQNAAAASGGKLTTLYGGVPVTVEGQVIGGVGVGGGSGEQDAEVARAGINALLEDLKKEGSTPSQEM